MVHHLPSLPYPLNALEPLMSAESLQVHHAKYHGKYIETLNSLVDEAGLAGHSLEDLIQTQHGPIFENATQAWNHNFYWNSMAPPSAEDIDGSLVLRAIERDFGDLNTLRTRFKEAALSAFGSAWVWLVQGEDGRLEIQITKDADCPLRTGKRPLLACDVWEHAYYLDHKNKRNRYIDAWWEIVHWKFAEENLLNEIAASN